MIDTAQISVSHRSQRWLLYAISVPVFAFAYHALWFWLYGEAVAIGDSAHPVVSLPHGIALSVLNFPMMYLWFPLGEWLKPQLTDDGVISLFAKVNAVMWGVFVTWLLLFLVRRIRRRQ